MNRSFLVKKPSLDGKFWWDNNNIPGYLMNSDIEKALDTFRRLKEFQYIEFNQGRPTYVFLMEDVCPYTPYDKVMVSITDRGDMKYVFVYNDPRPEERWWIVYQPINESGVPISTERCVGWFIDEYAALEKARDILAKPDRTSKVN
ncbi:hypothetical protein J7438_01410 [Thalassotalea sp. G20_0]|uniref:hypothetical protein n=1 Tax=Thalassotalea sp. G20_0 TaxID=2821093 RepID=UPI001ADC9B12|nr:hypothetical protein [Thalassotalea sp. G20_0]MBO9492750.1 hypothetical protein [Thalassotalea sp. G20_0]